MAFDEEKCEIVFCCRNDGRPSSSAWITSYGLGGSAAGDGNAAGLTYGQGGVLLGVDHWLDESTLVGLYGGYNYARFDGDGLPQRVQADSGQFGLYARRNLESRHFMYAGGFGFDNYDSARTIGIGNFNAVASGDYTGWQAVNYFEYGRTFETARGIRWQPYSALQYVHLRQNGFTETGAGVANLAVGGVDADSLRTIFGLRIERDVRTLRRHTLTPQARIGWLHEYLDTNAAVNNRFAGVAGTGFAAQGLDLGRDWALVGTGLSWRLSRRLTLAGNYDLQTNVNQTFHIGSADLQYVW